MFLSLACPVRAADISTATPLIYRETRPIVQDQNQRGALLSNSAWRRFVGQFGAEWTVDWYSATQKPARLYGRGVSLLTSRHFDSGEAIAVARAVIAENQLLFGIDPATLELRVATEVGGMGYVTYQLTHQGTSVEGATITFRFKAGRLFLIGVGPIPSLPPKDELTLQMQDAYTVVSDLVQNDQLTILPRGLVVFPVASDEGLVGRWAWQFESRSASLDRRERHTIDAQSGRELDRQSLVYDTTTSGTISITHDSRYPGTEIITSPAPSLTVSSGVGDTVTAGLEADAPGQFAFDLNGPDTLSMRLAGPYFKILDLSGTTTPTVTWEVNPGSDASYQWDDGDADLSLRDPYIFLHQARQRVIDIAPDLSFVNQQIEVNVNRAGLCNAFWNGSNLNFLQGGVTTTGLTCYPASRVDSVVIHEYGHALHQYALAAGSVFPDVGEGVADYLAATITNDPEIGVNLIADSALREIETNRRYPEDLVNEVHTDGLVIAGALWDLRTALIAEYGEVDGVAIADSLYLGMLRGGPNMFETYSELLAADDDDGDLSNGTLHVCEINAAFGQHGLGPQAVGTAFVSVDAPRTASFSGGALQVAAELVSTDPLCVPVNGQYQATLFYSGDGGSNYQPLAMDSGAGPNLFHAEIPIVRNNQAVHYYVQVEEGENTILAPRNAPQAVFSTFIGEIETIFFDDFEGEDPGWTTALVSGAEQEGANDWQLGAPSGRFGDPPEALSGQAVRGNDLALESRYNGAYQPNIVNRLISPQMDCRAYRTVRLQFMRWLTVEDAKFDRASIYVNNQLVWRNLATEGGVSHHEDDRWLFHDIDISRYAAKKRQVVIVWELTSDAALEKGGWTIDDVSVVGQNRRDLSGCRTLTGDLPPADDAVIWYCCLAILSCFYLRQKADGSQ